MASKEKKRITVKIPENLYERIKEYKGNYKLPEYLDLILPMTKKQLSTHSIRKVNDLMLLVMGNPNVKMHNDDVISFFDTFKYGLYNIINNKGVEEIIESIDGFTTKLKGGSRQ